MSIDLAFHRCANVRLHATFVSNSNSVTLEIEHDGVKSEIVFYGLPSSITDKFEAFRDHWTSDYDDHTGERIESAYAD